MFFPSIWPKVESLRHILTAELQRLAMGETWGALGKVSNVGILAAGTMTMKQVLKGSGKLSPTSQIHPFSFHFR